MGRYLNSTQSKDTVYNCSLWVLFYTNATFQRSRINQKATESRIKWCLLGLRATLNSVSIIHLFHASILPVSVCLFYYSISTFFTSSRSDHDGSVGGSQFNLTKFPRSHSSRRQQRALMGTCARYLTCDAKVDNIIMV